MLSVGGMRDFFNKFGNGCILMVFGVVALSMVIGFSGNQFGGRNPRGGGGNVTPADAVVATVNGQAITEADFREASAQMQQRMGGSAPAGPGYAMLQGQAIQNLIQRAVITQEAQKRNAHPLEADIDKSVDQVRQSVAQRLGKTKLSDSEWENYLETNRGMSASDVREQIAKSLVPMALVNTLKAEQKVTDAEARNQSAKVHLIVVSVPFQQAGQPASPTQKTTPLTETEAQTKANALYVRAKAGEDITKVAKSNPDDPTAAKNGGDAGTIDEYSSQAPGQFSMSLSLLYGKDFAEAVHKLTPGQVSEVIKVSGLGQHSFAFTKLVERKVNTPKDFDPKKAIAAITEQRAMESADTLIKSLVKSAKIEFKDPDKKAFYDYTKLQGLMQPDMQEMMSGQTAAPSKAETDAQQAVVDKEFEDMLKRHPEDVTAASLVAASLKARKMLDPASRDRLIALNETIAKSNDDFDKHFELADQYREKKQYDKAKTHLDRVAKLLSYNVPVDLDSMKSADATHRKLETAYRSINQPTEADKEKAISDALQTKITAASLKKLEEERKAKASAGTSGTGGMPPISLSPQGGTGSSQPITITPTPTTAPKTPPAQSAAPAGGAVSGGTHSEAPAPATGGAAPPATGRKP